MAASLAQAGNSVCIVDLDLQFGDVCHYLQLEPEKTIFDAQQAIVQNEADFFAENYSTSYSCGEVDFSVLAAPLKMEEAYNISAPAVQRVINSLRPQFDYIVVDTTAAFSELNLAVMDQSTLITFVGIVDFIPTIKNMKIGYDTMRSIGYEKNRIRFVLNRSDAKTSIAPEDVEQLLEERFYHAWAMIGGLPISYGVLGGLALMIKCLLTVAGVTALMATTRIADLCNTLRFLHVPTVCIFQLLLCFRYIRVLLEEAEQMSTAYLLRSPAANSIRLPDVGVLIGQLLLRSYGRAFRIYTAMKCRGFSGAGHMGHICLLDRRSLIFLTAGCLLLFVGRLVNFSVLAEVLIK